MTTTPSIKVVAVGDGAVGKSCMLITFTENRFPREYVPTVFDNFTTLYELDKQRVEISLWDTGGQEGYARIRTLSYPGTDVFLLCFSVTSRASFNNVTARWYPEIHHHCPWANILLVGMKTDLRADPGVELVFPHEGAQLAKSMGFVGYLECSALRGEGLQEVFDCAFRSVLDVRDPVACAKLKQRRKAEKAKPTPPALPTPQKAPWINVNTSTYANDLHRMLQDGQDCDVCFRVSHQLPDDPIPPNPRQPTAKAQTTVPKKRKKKTPSHEPKELLFEFVDEDDIDRDLLCPVCLDPLLEGVIHTGNECRNCFCRRCIEPLSRCPLCRGSIDDGVLTPVPRLVQNAIAKLSVSCKKCDFTGAQSEFPLHTCRPQAPTECKKQKKKQRNVKREKKERVYCAEEFNAPPKSNQPMEELWAHQLILVSASSFFETAIPEGNAALQEEVLPLSSDHIQAGISQITHECPTGPTSQPVIYVTLAPEIGKRDLENVLEFLYTGFLPPEKINHPNARSRLMRLAMLWDLPHLKTICENMASGNEWLNPSIGTWLNDENGARLSSRFGRENRNRLAEMFPLDRGVPFANQALLLSRCPAFYNHGERSSAGILQYTDLSGLFPYTSKGKEVDISTLQTFLDYLYSDHCSITPNNQYQLMELAHLMGVTRLVTLCELYISKTIEIETTEDIEQANVDVVGILDLAHRCHAQQLVAFCLHFISSNYEPMSQRADFGLLSGRDRAYVKANRWPPEAYLVAVAEYEEATASNGKSDCTVM